MGASQDVRVEWVGVGWRGRGEAWEEVHQTHHCEPVAGEECGLERERRVIRTSRDTRHDGGQPTCACADIGDELQCLLAGMVHADHLLSSLGSLLTLLHELVLVSSRVDHGQHVCL